MAADRIEVNGLRLLGKHGALPGEQDEVQPFEVDLSIETDLSPAGRSDALEDTLDYGALALAVARIVEESHHALLESLARAIADEVLEDRRVELVTVAVRKLRPPVRVRVDSIGVRITRRR